MDHWVPPQVTPPFSRRRAAPAKGVVFPPSHSLPDATRWWPDLPSRTGGLPQALSTLKSGWRLRAQSQAKWRRHILAPTSAVSTTSPRRKYQLAVTTQGASCGLQEDGPGWAAAITRHRTPHGPAWGKTKTIRSKAKQGPGRMNPKWHSWTPQFCVNVWCILLQA